MKFKNLLLLIFTFAVGVSIVWWNDSYKITVEKINLSIEKEVPKEASVLQVKTFLDKHKIDSTETLYPASVGYLFTNNPKLNDKRERIKTVMKAIIRNTEQDLFFTWGITLDFYFDEQGKLVEYSVEKFGTGL